ncbi:MAG: tetratricopeptide repeat protein [Phycisphaerales bacterium]|nr:tetratricopeptide repeat protein [Phycisphaerales bacterium]
MRQQPTPQPRAVAPARQAPRREAAPPPRTVQREAPPTPRSKPTLSKSSGRDGESRTSVGNGKSSSKGRQTVRKPQVVDPPSSGKPREQNPSTPDRDRDAGKDRSSKDMLAPSLPDNRADNKRSSRTPRVADKADSPKSNDPASPTAIDKLEQKSKNSKWNNGTEVWSGKKKFKDPVVAVANVKSKANVRPTLSHQFAASKQKQHFTSLSSCGHFGCRSHFSCVRSFHRPVFFSGSHCGSSFNHFGSCHSGSSFAFSISFSTCNPWWYDNCNWGWYGYDSCGYRPSWWYSYYYRPWVDYCWWYQPCYRPRSYCYRPLYYRTAFYPAYYSAYDYSVYDSSYDRGTYDSYDTASDGVIDTYPAPPADAFANLDAAWDSLNDGDVREARRAFERAVSNYPNDGLARIGYSLSTAMLGRHQEAVQAMRQALRDDPDSLNEVPQTDSLRQQLNQLLNGYQRLTNDLPDDVDAMFMTATVRYLLDEKPLALFIVEKAIEKGDVDPSARNLQSLIQSAMDDELDRDDDGALFEQPAPEAQASASVEVLY